MGNTALGPQQPSAPSRLPAAACLGSSNSGPGEGLPGTLPSPRDEWRSCAWGLLATSLDGKGRGGCTSFQAIHCPGHRLDTAWTLWLGLWPPLRKVLPRQAHSPGSPKAPAKASPGDASVAGVGPGSGQDRRAPSAVDSQGRQVPGSHMGSSGFPQTFLAPGVRCGCPPFTAFLGESWPSCGHGDWPLRAAGRQAAGWPGCAQLKFRPHLPL